VDVAACRAFRVRAMRLLVAWPAVGAGAALWLSGCLAPPKAPPFAAIRSEPAAVRWQQGTHVSVLRATCEKAASGSVRVTLDRPGAGSFVLEPDGRLIAPNWTGQVGAAPPGLSVWGSFLTIWQNADRLPPGDREFHTPATRIAVRKTARGLESVGIRSLDAPESLNVVFRPGRQSSRPGENPPP
jgi:hypothetical protein